MKRVTSVRISRFTPWLVSCGLAALLMAVIGCTSGQADVKSVANQRDLVEVERVDYPVLVSASGILEAEQNVSLGPPKISHQRRFKLARIVDEGTEVFEGDFVMEFDGSDISRRLRDVTAQYQKVQQEYQKKRSDFEIQRKDLKLQLDQAKADWDKLDNKLNQQQELESRIQVEETKMRRDQARTKFELLQKKVKELEKSGRLDLQLSRSNENHYKAQIDRLMDAMDSLTVRAPVAGVVIHRKGWNGEGKRVGDFVHGPETVVDLPDLKTLRVKAMVDEIDAGKVQVGQPARIQVDAVQGRVIEGEVDSISGILRQAAADRPQKIAEVFIRLTESDLDQMRPGMSAKTQIEVDRYTGVLVIPMVSILEQGGRSFVRRLNSERKKFELQEIQIQTSDGVTAVVSSGLDEGDIIRSNPKH